ncbi:MAG: hypothetical protein SH847_20670 [Roseiflexaceae bacterium]|nr:hypothetical protein [Roseiflexaceae bacterium]
MAVTQLPKTVATKGQEQIATHVATGAAAAAFLAGGIGCFVLGLLVTLAAMPSLIGLKNALNWSNPVGPLSGKTGVTVIAFLVSWVIAHFMMKDKNVDLKLYVIISGVLTALGFLLTFPPFFDLFAGV